MKRLSDEDLDYHASNPAVWMQDRGIARELLAARRVVEAARDRVEEMAAPEFSGKAVSKCDCEVCQAIKSYDALFQKEGGMSCKKDCYDSPMVDRCVRCYNEEISRFKTALEKAEAENKRLREAMREISTMSYGTTGGMDGWISATLVIIGKTLAKTESESKGGDDGVQ